jgi:hypothetical protein
MKMALVMPAVMVIAMLSAGFRIRSSAPSAGETWTYFATTGVIAMMSFSLAPTMSNVFGLDRDGFRALVLLPSKREKILLAKNLAFVPFAAGVAVVALLVAKIMLGLPWETFAIGLLQWPAAFMLFSTICNFFSILLPYRLAEGTLQAQKPRAVVFVAGFGAMMVAPPVIMVPIMIPPGLKLLFSTMNWLPWLPVGTLAGLAIFAATAWLYRVLLPLQGRLLHRREQRVLREVTADAE